MYLSIIIPVYNCENLVSRCIESIELQGDYCFEIILVNDGSKDNSLDVCLQLSKRYKNIRVFTHRNKGTSTTRNRGLSESKGDYVWFVDADDYIPNGFFSKLFYVLKAKQPDVLTFNYQYITRKGETYRELYIEERFMKCIDFLRDNPCMFAATKVYKKSSLGSLKFLDGLKNIEDFLFNIQYLSSHEYIYTLSCSGYVYDHTNENSTSLNRSLRNLIKTSSDSITVHTTILNELKHINDNNMLEVVQAQLNYSIAGHLYSLVAFYNTKRLKKTIKMYEEMGLYPIKHVNKKRAKYVIHFMNHKRLLIMFSFLYKFRFR